MDQLITVKAVADRYGCSNKTARKYIRQCQVFMENPLVTYDWAFQEWEQARIVVRPDISRKAAAGIISRQQTRRIIVPRKR